MCQKKFSIIFPTRERVDLLNNLLFSIKNTTHNIDSIEVLVAYDSDDEKTKSYISSTGPDITSFTKFIECQRSLNFSRDYYTHLFKLSSGKWIIVCNDDAIFETPNWDSESENVLVSFVKDSPNIVLGWIEDYLGSARLVNFGNYCCFPLFGREGVELLSYVFPDSIPIWGADIWAWNLYAMSGRVVKVPMAIRHICPHNGLREADDVHKRVQKNSPPVNFNPKKEEIIKFKAALNGK